MQEDFGALNLQDLQATCIQLLIIETIKNSVSLPLLNFLEQYCLSDSV